MTDYDDRIRELFPPVVPLNAPPGSLGRITRAARRRKRTRLLSSLASCAVVLAVLGFASREAWPTAPPASSGRVPHCRSADLRLSVLSGSTAGTTAIGVDVLITNRGPGRCEVSGYPDVSLLSDVGGSTLAVAHPGHTELWADPGIHPVPLDPGTAAVFGVEWVPSDGTCSSSPSAISGLEAGLPGQPPLPAVALTDAGCLRGDLTVTPLVADSVGLTPTS